MKENMFMKPFEKIEEVQTLQGKVKLYILIWLIYNCVG